MGSSTVMIDTGRVPLMWSTIAAIVELLPEPDGPVIRIIPFCSLARRRTTAGRPRSSKLGDSDGTRRITRLTDPRWRKAVTRKRPSSGRPKAKSASPRSLNSLTARWVKICWPKASVSSGRRVGRP